MGGKHHFCKFVNKFYQIFTKLSNDIYIYEKKVKKSALFLLFRKVALCFRVVSTSFATFLHFSPPYFMLFYVNFVKTPTNIPRLLILNAKGKMQSVKYFSSKMQNYFLSCHSER